MIDKLVLCSCCACEDAAGVKVSKISLRSTLWPIYFDVDCDVDFGDDYDDDCDVVFEVDVDDNYYDNY